MADGLSVRKPVSRSHSGLEAESNGLLGGAGHRKMLRDHFRLRLKQMAKARFNRLGNLEMKLPPPCFANGAVEGLFDENVLKSVNGCGRLPRRIENARRQK